MASFVSFVGAQAAALLLMKRNNEQKTKRNLCPGCAVREPWEHRCHGTFRAGSGASILCECPECSQPAAKDGE